MARKLLPAIGFLLPLVLLLTLTLTWGAAAQPAGTEAAPAQGFQQRIQPTPTSVAPSSASAGEQDLTEYEQKILLWPKVLPEFAEEYASWSSWLEDVPITRYAPRDELLVSAQAIASQVPGLTVETDAPDSDLIFVSGNVAAVWALRERLRGTCACCKPTSALYLCASAYTARPALAGFRERIA